MTNNAAQILVPQNSDVYLAVTGTAAPTDLVTTPAVGWKHTGLFTPDSLTFQTEPQFEEVTSMQSNYPTRRFQSSDSANIAVDLQQWNKENLAFAMGGGTTVVASTIATFTPPLPGSRAEVACLIHVIDGTKLYRFIFPRVQNVEGSEISFNKSGASLLGLRLSVLGGDAVSPWTMITNDPAFTT